ncbi:MAG: trimeric intracellular cation channel family protein [Christensenellaceae bacterium]|nr:trimeric intracellular cation channel family protein [Christensenellaceae bacterium]
MNILWLIFEIIGTVAFAISGALLAVEKENDIFGVLFLGVTTAVGGGIMRDILTGELPPKAFQDPVYVLIAGITSLIVFFLMYFTKGNIRKKLAMADAVINVFDAVGLGVFTIFGMNAAAELGHGENLFLRLFVGMITGVGGGIIRDILVREIPSVLCKRVYAVASLIGGLFYYFLVKLGMNAGIANFIGAASIFIIRMLASKFRWDLPKVDLDK